jgi:hypothetical protein
VVKRATTAGGKTRRNPATKANFLSIRVHDDLRKLLAVEAERDGRTMSSWVATMLAEHFRVRYGAPVTLKGELQDKGWSMPPESPSRTRMR